jgi:signal peptidase I
LTPLDVTDTDEIPGDRVIVNKAAYRVRSPSRWEIVVLRLFGSAYIKRLLGLPGEEILIHDGDLYVNGQLQRKTYAQARRVRVLIFDQDKMPAMTAAKNRWEFDPPRTLDKNGAIHLDGTVTPASLAYQNLSLETGKCEPLRDEYAYNAGVHADSECVHDFLIETEIEPTKGAGSLALRLCDGHDWVEVHLPIAIPDSTNRILRVGQRYRVEMAFVDRRMSVTIDHQLWHEIDLPEAKQRNGVTRPFLIQADGVRATLHSFRLYRDVHYGQQGKQAVRGKMVRLGVDQYFVLGDNSPHSEDSRHWPNEGRVSFADLIGPLMWGY